MCYIGPMSKDASNTEILAVVSFIKDRVVGIEEKVKGLEENVQGLSEKVDRIETEMMKMRDDIRAVDAKVSGIWNVLDVHTDRIKKLEADV